MANLRKTLEVTKFVAAGREFCGLLKRRDLSQATWALYIVRALLDLMATITRLPRVNCGDRFPERYNVSSEDRKKLSDELCRFLDRYDAYWGFFDILEVQVERPEPILRSLANDLTHIYADLAPSLSVWESETEGFDSTVVFDFVDMFYSHWEKHATGAIVALAALAFEVLKVQDQTERVYDAPLVPVHRPPTAENAAPSGQAEVKSVQPAKPDDAGGEGAK
jgi:hypothetical protein